MSYRPQFPFKTPPEYQDKDFVHYFDQTNTPQLNNALSLAVGATVLGIPLVFEADAPFTWRGIKINGPSNFAVRFRDPYNNYLSDDFVQIPLQDGPQETSIWGSLVVDLEPQIRCPLGTQILVDIKRIS